MSSLITRTVFRAATPIRLLSASLARTHRQPLSPPSPLLLIRQQQQQQTAAMSSATAFLDLVKARRTHYALSKDLPVSKERIQEIVNHAVPHVPSSFNSQPNRVVVLFGAEHDKFWGIVGDTLKAIVPADAWPASEARVNGFKAGAGSILFFEDQTTNEEFQAKFAIYADKFPGWTTQSDAMLQYTLWLAFEAEGLGANLQHYNPIVDDKVAAAWGLPATWKLNAQLVFGKKAGEAGDKTFKPIEERVKVFGA